MNAPLISVVCPTFNSAAFVSATLDTVLKQSLAPLELIIVDDGSTDDTVRIVETVFSRARERFDCKLLCYTHRGPGAARNAGILAARGDWIAFLDSDDLWQSDKLAVMADAIVLNRDKNFFCHNELRLCLSGETLLLNYGARYRPDYPLFRQLYHANMFSTSALICEKKLLIDRGLFDEALSSAQDYELWLRLSPHVQPHFVERVLGQYIERRGNITSGSLYKRFRNECHIAARYAGKVSYPGRFKRFVRIFLSFCWQSFGRIRNKFTAFKSG